jgi:glycosyltransferase involved in cell wall biosynthesis
MLRLVSLLRRLKPDIVHSYMGHQNIYGRIAARMAGEAKVIGSVRCTRLPRSYIRQERLTHSFTDALIVNSSQIKDELIRRARIPADGIIVVENGVDTSRFRPLEDRTSARARFEMHGTTLVVPGRISFQKNQVAIVRAVARMRRRGAWPEDARVLFAGRQEASTRYGALLRAVIALTRTSDVVRFAGVVRDIEQLVGAADAVLLPSRYEGLPNAVLESMAAGTPAIVSPAANADRLVADGERGIALSGDDPRAIEEGLSRFFAVGAAERRAMGDRGREQALTRFSLARMVSETCAVYDRVLSKTS